MAIERYSQCLLRHGNTTDVAWIDDVYAITGRPLKIKIKGRWQNGWNVEEVYSTRLADFVEAHERDHMLMATYG